MGKITTLLLLIIIGSIVLYSYTDFFERNNITANTIKDLIIKKEVKTIEENGSIEVYFTKTKDITPIFIELSKRSTDISWRNC